MELLEDFNDIGQGKLVCKLKRTLDGIKQCLRQWYKHIHSCMFQIGYIEGVSIIVVFML